MRRLLGESDIQQAFADIDAELFHEWRIARTPEDRESLHAVERAFRRLQGKLQSWADELALRRIE